MEWGNSKTLGYVTGATHPQQLEELRNLYPDRVFLIPGVGSQGGKPEEVIIANKNKYSFVNVSRSIIFAGEDEDIINECKKFSESLRFDSK